MILLDENLMAGKIEDLNLDKKEFKCNLINLLNSSLFAGKKSEEYFWYQI